MIGRLEFTEKPPQNKSIRTVLNQLLSCLGIPAGKDKNLSTFIINNRRELNQLSLIVLVSLTIRLLALPWVPTEIALDNPTYQDAASDIMRGGFIANNSIMPLYPLFLALFGGGEKVQIFIGMITSITSIVLAWALARTLFEDKKTGLVAAGMMAVYPMHIYYSVMGLTESLFIPLTLGAFIALHKNRVISASILFVLSILTRPVMDAFAPFVIFWHALVVRKKGTSRAFRDLAIYGILYALIMSPWWYHNEKKFGSFKRLNNGFGTVLYAGNNPMNVSGGAIGKIDYDLDNVISNNLPHSRADEAESALKHAAIEYIRNNPGHFFKMAGVKFVRFWSLIPYTPMVKGNKLALIATLSLLPIIVFAIVTLISRRDLFWRLTPILGFIAFLTLVHMITVGSIRYRYPLEPLLIVIAAPSLLLVWNHIFGKIIT